METAASWAVEEFGGAQLGDRRRRDRLVAIARSVAERPAGTVTKVMHVPAEREAAFRLLESRHISVEEVARASHIATARRCASSSLVVVAVDQSTLSLTDHTCTKGFGKAGAGKSRHVRALEVMSALAVDESGMTLGVLGQEWWNRPDGPSRCVKHDRRPPEERESDLFRRTMLSATDALSRHAPGTEPWFQIDRGGDFWRVLEFADETGTLLTVRAAHNRRLVDDDEYLSTTIAACAPSGSYVLQVAARTDRGVHRAARAAVVEVRYAPVQLRMMDYEERHIVVNTIVVDVIENRPPKDAERLHWRLLTTYPVESLNDAILVVDSYAKRWRIEDFHRTWKSGACDIERSQLRSPDAFMLWATILAAVAARIERLKHISRQHPDQPAETEFTRHEIDAAIILSKTKKFTVGATLTMGEAVRLVADIGGYTGKSSGGPPGAMVIGRGLEYVVAAASAVEHLRSG